MMPSRTVVDHLVVPAVVEEEAFMETLYRT
jgi:hypothetical protein